MTLKKHFPGKSWNILPTPQALTWVPAAISCRKQKLAAKYGEGLYYHWEVAPELLGGIRIQVGDDVRDGSVRSKIDRLADLARSLSN